MATSDGILQKSTVYAFYVPSANAIKVGFGTDGRARMRDYSRQYSLSSSAKSLREWNLPSPSLASSIETACHRALLQADFGRVSHAVDEREARELFDLGHHSYEQAVLVVAEAIEETISSLYEALGQLKPLSQEKARQQKQGAQRRREAIREEKKQKTKDEEKRLISAATPQIQGRWRIDVEPFAKSCDSARALRKEFNYSQGLISAFWNGKQSAALRMAQWDRWPLIKQLISEIFQTARRAKAFYWEMESTHGDYAEKAAMSLGLSLSSPGGHALPMVRTRADKRSEALLEVRLVVQLATGLGGDGASEVMNIDADIMGLVKYAAQSPAPELVGQKGNDTKRKPGPGRCPQCGGPALGGICWSNPPHSSTRGSP